MVRLTRFRLVNWYAFSDVESSVGAKDTMITGLNGAGKSVILDAIRYAAYGDTVFNKSAGNRQTERTLPSYTRGLLNEDTKGYIRPASSDPIVYTHILLEYFDEGDHRSFVCGTVIETPESDATRTFRYVADRRTLKGVAVTEERPDGVFLLSAHAVGKANAVEILPARQGLERFLQFTGMRMSLEKDLPEYRNRLRALMSYTGTPNVGAFIRNSVLPERTINIDRLINEKKGIDSTMDQLKAVDSEIANLDMILKTQREWEKADNQLFRDSVFGICRDIADASTRMDELKRREEVCRQEAQGAERKAATYSEEENRANEQAQEAAAAIKSMDSSRLVEQERQNLASLKVEKEVLARECTKLEGFQESVAQTLQTGRMDGTPETDILLRLCDSAVEVGEKVAAIEWFKGKLKQELDEKTRAIHKAEDELGRINRERADVARMIDEYRNNRPSYAEIPEYVKLRAEINRAFKKRSIGAEARFACEYVSEIKDEEWRYAIETFLGRRRYTVLVPPEYYDIADDVMNRLKSEAHLFNTKLLMKREITVADGSVRELLEVKNPVAGRYFDYFLGRMRMADTNDVRNHAYAISKEGRVSKDMDGYFLKRRRGDRYYLGQEAMELNLREAEKRQKELEDEFHASRDFKEGLTREVNVIESLQGSANREYSLNAHSDYARKELSVLESEHRLEQLKKDLEGDPNFARYDKMRQEAEDVCKKARRGRESEIARKSQKMEEAKQCRQEMEKENEKRQRAERDFESLETERPDVVGSAHAEFDTAIKAGKSDKVRPHTERWRKEKEEDRNESQNELLTLQATYAQNHPEISAPRGTDKCGFYVRRREHIRIDDREVIVAELEERKRRYENLFKNEFVLRILESCEDVSGQLKKDINRELSDAGFQSNLGVRYEFDVKYEKEDSDYGKIISYARYLKERKDLGNYEDGQYAFGVGTSNEAGESLEREVDEIVGRLASGNGNDEMANIADYRNYLNCDIVINDPVRKKQLLSRQIGYASGAEVQIPCLLMLTAALLLLYRGRTDSARLAFIDEPFSKMDPTNVKAMLQFMQRQGLQVILCTPDKQESIGNECDVIIAVFRNRPGEMDFAYFVPNDGALEGGGSDGGQ